MNFRLLISRYVIEHVADQRAVHGLRSAAVVGMKIPGVVKPITVPLCSAIAFGPISPQPVPAR